MVDKVFCRTMCIVYILFLFAYTHFHVPHLQNDRIIRLEKTFKVISDMLF